MPIEIVMDEREINKALERLKGVPWALQRAVYPAIAETLQHVRAAIYERLEGDVPIDPKDIKKAIRLKMPGRYGNEVVGDATVRAHYTPLIDYDVEPKAITAQKGVPTMARRDFSYALRTGGKRYPGRYLSLQLIAAGYHSGTFIAKMPGRSHVGVYARKGSGDYAAEIMGPTVQYHAARPEVEQAVVDTALAEFPAILDRHVQDVLSVEAAK